MFNQLSSDLHDAARKKGFHYGNADSLISYALSKLALIGEELGEACTAVRKPGQSEHIPNFTGLEEEMADIMIRVFDFCGEHNLDLQGAFDAKVEYNRSRAYMHGKKA